MSEKLNTKLTFFSTIFIISIANLVLHLLTISNASASSDADYSFTVDFDRYDCQQINSAYQAVYAFETANFYVNICQKGNAYFYSGEAKHSNLSSIFIPAHPLENGSGFEAKNGNVSYLVILPFSQNIINFSTSDRSEAILTIKRNDRLVSIESSLSKYCHQSETSIVWDNIEVQPHDSSQVATVPLHQDVNSSSSLAAKADLLLPTEIFNSDSRFDFYRLGGELHRLTTCN